MIDGTAPSTPPALSSPMMNGCGSNNNNNCSSNNNNNSGHMKAQGTLPPAGSDSTNQVVVVSDNAQRLTHRNLLTDTLADRNRRLQTLLGNLDGSGAGGGVDAVGNQVN